MKQRDPSRAKIVKTRRCFLWNHHYYQMDIYKEPPNDRLVDWLWSKLPFFMPKFWLFTVDHLGCWNLCFYFSLTLSCAVSNSLKNLTLNKIRVIPLGGVSTQFWSHSVFLRKIIIVLEKVVLILVFWQIIGKKLSDWPNFLDIAW